MRPKKTSEVFKTSEVWRWDYYAKQVIRVIGRNDDQRLELDYLVLELEDSPGAKEEIGVLSPIKASLKTNQPAFIIQHPQGESQKVVLQENWMTYVATDQRRVQYLTNTMGGSSGSPVFNEKWDVVALHHSGQPVPALPEKMNIRGNEGIPMVAILPEIQDLLA